MMQQMRDNMKVIIWVTAIVFLVGFGVLQLGGVLNPPSAQGPAGIIAKINGEPIRYDEFMGLYQNIINQIRQSRELQEGEDSYIREQAWQEMLQTRLIGQEVRKRGIKISPEEIKVAIRLMPPQFVVQAPIFQTNGKFDYRKYLAELDNPNSQVPWAQVEDYVAQSLPQQKLQQEIASTAKVSEADVRQRFRLINEKLNARFVWFAADSFPVDTSKIGGADIETYYKSHPQVFTGPPEVKLQIAVVPRRPKEADFAVAKEKMMGIRDQIAAQPDSFPKYARAYSELGNNIKGGDAEALYSGLRPEYQAALKQLQPGQLSDVIREERTVHLLRLDKRFDDPKTKQMMVHFHEIGFRVQPGADAIRDARKSVSDLIAAAHKDGLSKAALRAGFLTQEGPYFREGTSNNRVFDQFPEAEHWAFSAKVGSISTPIPTESGWYIYEILDRQKSGLRPLMQSRVFARERLIASLQLDRAADAAAQAAAALASGSSDIEVAKRFHGTTDVANDVTPNGYVGRLGVEPQINGALFAQPVGSWGKALPGVKGAMVGFVLQHPKPTEDDYKQQAGQIRSNLLQSLQQKRFQDWMLQLRRNAKIEDYRENYFEA